MATPILVKESHLNDFAKGSQVSIGSVHGPVIMLNRNALQLSSHPTNPFKQLDGTDTYAANACIVTAPPNASYLNLWCEWTGTLTVVPTIRAFGELAIRQTLGIHPGEVDSAYGNPFTYNYGATTAANAELVYPSSGGSGTAENRNQYDWHALPALAETSPYLITVGSTTEVWTNGTSKRGAMVTINLFGTRRQIITIASVAAATKACIAGYFGR